MPKKEFNSRITIGSRGSKLALWQAHHVKDLLLKVHPQLQIEVHTIKTAGDKIIDKSLATIGGKGLFLKEIEDELLNHKIALAVHSMKDVPHTLPSGLEIVAMLKRADVRDVLLSQKNKSLQDLPTGSVVGTSSLRRLAQLKNLRPNLVYRDLRGNVDTRLKKLHAGQYEAIVLAAAGLKRLGLEKEITEYLDIIPAVGQGAIGIEIRADDHKSRSLLQSLNDPETFACVTVERAFSQALQGDCQTPLGCLAVQDGDQIAIQAFLADATTNKFVSESIKVKASQAVGAARLLATKFSK